MALARAGARHRADTGGAPAGTPAHRARDDALVVLAFLRTRDSRGREIRMRGMRKCRHLSARPDTASSAPVAGRQGVRWSAGQRCRNPGARSHALSASGAAPVVRRRGALALPPDWHIIPAPWRAIPRRVRPASRPPRPAQSAVDVHAPPPGGNARHGKAVPRAPVDGLGRTGRHADAASIRSHPARTSRCAHQAVRNAGMKVGAVGTGL